MRVRHSPDRRLHRLRGVTGSRLTRSRALALLAGAAAAPQLIRPARAADPLSVRLDWSPHAMHCSFHLAVEQGWFKKADLDVRIEDGNGSTTTVQIVGGGGFDVGHAALAPMAIGRGAGLPVISVAGVLRTGDMGILVDSKLKVTKLEELQGKKIDYTAGSLEGPRRKRGARCGRRVRFRGCRVSIWSTAPSPIAGSFPPNRPRARRLVARGRRLGRPPSGGGGGPSSSPPARNRPISSPMTIST